MAEYSKVRHKKCAACGVGLTFLLTGNGGHMPCNSDTVDAGEYLYDDKKHVSHFKTCTDPDRFSGRTVTR